MLTIPSLIVVAVTPRKDAVSATGPPDVEVVAAAGAVVVGAAFLALLEQPTSALPTKNNAAICVAKRERAICPPFAPGPAGHGSVRVLRVTRSCRRSLLGACCPRSPGSPTPPCRRCAA